MHQVNVTKMRGAGHVAVCAYCQAREAFETAEEAKKWGDIHEFSPTRVNRGPRPSLTTLERLYRTNSESAMFTREQRQQWKDLADEIATQIKKKQDIIDGQIALFDTEELT